MPVTADLDNEMPVELNNEMPVSAVNGLPETNAENVEDRHIVNGDSYASRAVRTASYEYLPCQQRAEFLKRYASGQEPRFLLRAKIQRPSRYLKLLRKPKSTRRKSHAYNGRLTRRSPSPTSLYQQRRNSSD